MTVTTVFATAFLSCTVAVYAAGQTDTTIRDQDVKLVSFADLEYPKIAKAARIQGVVVVRASLGDHGEVVGASALSGAAALISEAVSNAKKWRFVPGPQKTVILVYDFRLDEAACHDDSRSLFRLIHWNLASVVSCTGVLK